MADRERREGRRGKEGTEGRYVMSGGVACLDCSGIMCEFLGETFRFRGFVLPLFFFFFFCFF